MDNNNYYQQTPVQQTVPQAPVTAPNPAPTPVTKKKPAAGAFGKQHIFMAVAILLGKGIIPAVLSAISSGINTVLIETMGYYDSSYSSATLLVSSIHSLVLGLITLVIYALFGYLAYKKLAKAACFIGVSYVAVLISGFITNIFSVLLSIIGIIVNAVDSYAYYDYLAVSNILNGLVSVFGIIIAIAAGVFLLMIVEKGKLNLNIKKKNKTVAPQAPVQQNNPQI